MSNIMIIKMTHFLFVLNWFEFNKMLNNIEIIDLQ